MYESKRGYVRYQCYVHKDLIQAMKAQAEKENLTIAAFIESALVRRIKYAGYDSSLSRKSVIERQLDVLRDLCSVSKSATK